MDLKTRWERPDKKPSGALSRRFDDTARRVTENCRCGQYKETHRTYEPGIVWLHYGPIPGSAGIYGINLLCRHRRVKVALIKAYRTGRAEAK